MAMVAGMGYTSGGNRTAGYTDGRPRAGAVMPHTAGVGPRMRGMTRVRAGLPARRRCGRAACAWRRLVSSAPEQVRPAECRHVAPQRAPRVSRCLSNGIRGAATGGCSLRREAQGISRTRSRGDAVNSARGIARQARCEPFRLVCTWSSCTFSRASCSFRAP